MEEPSGREISAAFPLEELLSSPLTPALSTEGWTRHEAHGLQWLEHPLPGQVGPLYITGKASSSLDIAKRLAELDLFPVWSTVLVLSQSAGRGQMRREWTSPEGNIYAAMRLPMEPPFSTFAAAPAIGGLLAEALTQEGCPVLLKWPNDILQPAKEFTAGTMPGRGDCHKVAGILLEERRGSLIAGIGINLTSAPPRSALRDDHVFDAGILRTLEGTPLLANTVEKAKESSQDVTIFTLWKRLVERIFSCYANKTNHDSWWLPYAERHLAFLGCRVSFADACPEDDTMTRIPCEGIVDGVTPSGALRLRSEYGMDTLLGGSLLPGS